MIELRAYAAKPKESQHDHSAQRQPRDRHVRTLRLDRPELKNALNPELAWAIIAALEEARRARGHYDLIRNLSPSE